MIVRYDLINLISVKKKKKKNYIVGSTMVIPKLTALLIPNTRISLFHSHIYNYLAINSSSYRYNKIYTFMSGSSGLDLTSILN